jgi:hypothetical protein
MPGTLCIISLYPNHKVQKLNIVCENYFSERIANGFSARVGVEWHVHEIESDFKVLHSVMISHNGMIDGDEKRLDSGVASLPSTFRNFVRG